VQRRLLVSYLSITVFVLLVLEIPLGFAYAQSERRRFTSAVQHDALALAVRAEEALEGGDSAAVRDLAETYQRETDARVVVVDRAGRLLVDSDPTRSGPRSFADRPEFREALNGSENSGTRFSETLDQDLLYFAVPVVNGNEVIGAVRVTHPTSFLDARIRRTWAVLAGVGAVVLAVVFLVSLRLARQVTKPLDGVERAAARLGAGELDSRAPVPDGPAEIRALAESFNRTAGRLEELVASQQAFVADASHQLRTPLAALRLRLENLESELEHPDAASAAAARDDAVGALTEVGRLSRLVDGLLELARAERGTGIARAVPVDAVVAGRVDAWTALAGEREVALAIEVDPGLAVLSVPGRLEQVLDNLLANALDVAPPSTAVTVAVHRRADRVEIAVRDRGRGMTPEQRSRAFDRFWRPSGADRDGGSGLGLAIVERLVSADAGSVALDETPGGGLTATLTLPAA
jgi:signal transduction histidine kinase